MARQAMKQSISFSPVWANMPGDRLLHTVDRYFNLSEYCRHVAGFYGRTGRHFIDQGSCG
jgi:hypothetical protein